MKKLQTLILGLFFVASSTIASAVNVGVTVTGVALDGVKGSETQSSQTRSEDLAVAYGSVFVEAEMDNGFAIGFDYAPIDVESETSTNAQTGPGLTDSGTTTVQVDIVDNKMIYAIVPLMDTGIYIKAGASEADLNTNESMLTGSNYPDATLDGTHVSIGFERDSGDFAVRLEAGISEYDDVTVTGTDGDGDANTITVNGLDGQHVRVSLVKAF